MKHTPLHAALSAIAVASLAAFASYAQGVQAAPAAAAEGHYCYSWGFLNASSGDATGLRFKLAGVRTVDTVYTGAANPFGAADATSGFDATTNSYALNFSNGVAFNGDEVQAGLCTNTPALSLSSASWTSGGGPVGDPPRYLGVRFNWVSSGQLRVELLNPLPVTARLATLNVLRPDQPLSLDDLNATVAAQLPMVTEAITAPVDVPPQGTFAVDVSFAQADQLTVGQALVVDAVLLPQDDPDNGVHLVAQTLGQLRRVSLPVVLR